MNDALSITREMLRILDESPMMRRMRKRAAIDKIKQQPFYDHFDVVMARCNGWMRKAEILNDAMMARKNTLDAIESLTGFAPVQSYGRIVRSVGECEAIMLRRRLDKPKITFRRYGKFEVLP